MPFYNYKCDKCDESKDELVKFSDADTKTFECQCGGTMTRVPFVSGDKYSTVYKGNWIKTTGRY